MACDGHRQVEGGEDGAIPGPSLLFLSRWTDGRPRTSVTALSADSYPLRAPPFPATPERAAKMRHGAEHTPLPRSRSAMRASMGRAVGPQLSLINDPGGSP